MNKFYEPNSDLPHEIYKDWLADQGYDELRDIDFYSLITCCRYYDSWEYFDIGDRGNLPTGNGHCFFYGYGDSMVYHHPYYGRVAIGEEVDLGNGDNGIGYYGVGDGE